MRKLFQAVILYAFMYVLARASLLFFYTSRIKLFTKFPRCAEFEILMTCCSPFFEFAFCSCTKGARLATRSRLPSLHFIRPKAFSPRSLSKKKAQLKFRKLGIYSYVWKEKKVTNLIAHVAGTTNRVRTHQRLPAI